jgi:hypothetical protein
MMMIAAKAGSAIPKGMPRLPARAGNIVPEVPEVIPAAIAAARPDVPRVMRTAVAATMAVGSAIPVDMRRPHAAAGKTAAEPIG